MPKIKKIRKKKRDGKKIKNDYCRNSKENRTPQTTGVHLLMLNTCNLQAANILRVE